MSETQDPEADTSNRGTLPVGDLAKLLMLSERRIQQLAEEGYTKRAGNGRYYTAASIQGYIRFLIEEKKAKSGLAAQNRVSEARAADIEQRTALRNHTLIELAEALAVVDEISGSLKSAFDGFGAQMTRDLPMRKKIEAGIHDIFARVAKRVAEAAAALKSSGEIVDPDSEDDAE